MGMLQSLLGMPLLAGIPVRAPMPISEDVLYGADSSYLMNRQLCTSCLGPRLRRCSACAPTCLSQPNLRSNIEQCFSTCNGVNTFYLVSIFHVIFSLEILVL
jgi:hypothetical protein